MSERFKQYKRKLRWKSSIRKHGAEEENWDTGETWDWISNDEGLYDMAHEAVRHNWQNPGAALRQLMAEYASENEYYNVDLDEVDWDSLAEQLDEELAEQAGHEAQEFLNPPPTVEERFGHLPPDQNPLMWQAGDVIQDQSGSRAHVQGPYDPNRQSVPLTHIAPDRYYHGEDYSLHPSALVNTYGYQRVDNKPLDHNWLADPQLDQPGELTLPEHWSGMVRRGVEIGPGNNSTECPWCGSSNTARDPEQPPSRSPFQFAQYRCGDCSQRFVPGSITGIPAEESDPQAFGHPDPMMDNEPGTLRMPEHWGGARQSGDLIHGPWPGSPVPPTNFHDEIVGDTDRSEAEQPFPEDVNPCRDCGGSGMSHLDPNDYCRTCKGSGVNPS